VDRRGLHQRANVEAGRARFLCGGDSDRRGIRDRTSDWARHRTSVGAGHRAGDRVDHRTSDRAADGNSWWRC